MKPKILTVDDSKTIRLIVAKAFKTFDCEIFEAANGVEGLALATREKPSIIILDLTMPIMDGAEMLSRLKSNPDLKNIPVVMLTAEAGRENVLRIAKLGVRDYLVKPFKEELLVERVCRVVDLKPKGDASTRVRRFDEAIHLLVIDDKPAILDQVKAGLTGLPWNIQGRALPAEATAYCNQTPPDLVLLSLSLPDGAGFNLFQAIRANPKTKHIPVFGLCVKTAMDEQTRAQQSGFAGVITKPIDFEDLKSKIARALHLDTSYRYFQNEEGILVLRLPAVVSQHVANEVTLHLRAKLAEAVDAGIDKMVIDLGQLKTADVNLVKLGLSALQMCTELSLKQRIIGSEAVRKECKLFEETKDWRFVGSFAEAKEAFDDENVFAAA